MTPTSCPDGRIMVFDNRRDESGRQVFGGSRILAIDPVTREVQTLYVGAEEAPFFSNVKGKQQLLANGNVLITEAERGRAFEVTPDGRIVWSYISRLMTITSLRSAMRSAMRKAMPPWTTTTASNIAADARSNHATGTAAEQGASRVTSAG